MMTKTSRLVLATASLALLLAYFLPIWRISLEAPQYPEGLGMYIRINDVTGIGKNDLQNINGLNHYIGMKEIHPESIPELDIMPWIIGGLVILGLGAAAGGKRGMLYGWIAVFVLVAVIGLVDFYLWEYDYGHDLNPEASIKVPGMSYQPPLIGSRKLLNFNATSWPAAGGLIVFLSLAAGVFLGIYEFLRSRRTKQLSQIQE